MITKNHRQEILSWAYVRSIAARCGFVCSVPELDYGIDLTIHDVFREEDAVAESGNKIDAQLKSSSAAVLTDTTVLYDLEVDGYNVLRKSGVLVPRLLVVHVLPADEDDWTVQSEEVLGLRRCAYWLNLLGMPATKNKRTIRLTIPRANVFSVVALDRLMECVRRRENLC